MTEYEKMVKGLIYDPMDPEITGEQGEFQRLVWEFNRLSPAAGEEYDGDN